MSGTYLQTANVAIKTPGISNTETGAPKTCLFNTQQAIFQCRAYGDANKRMASRGPWDCPPVSKTLTASTGQVVFQAGPLEES